MVRFQQVEGGAVDDPTYDLLTKMEATSEDSMSPRSVEGAVATRWEVRHEEASEQVSGWSARCQGPRFLHCGKIRTKQLPVPELLTVAAEKAALLRRPFFAVDGNATKTGSDLAGSLLPAPPNPQLELQRQRQHKQQQQQQQPTSAPIPWLSPASFTATRLQDASRQPSSRSPPPPRQRSHSRTLQAESSLLTEQRSMENVTVLTSNTFLRQASQPSLGSSRQFSVTPNSSVRFSVASTTVPNMLSSPSASSLPTTPRTTPRMGVSILPCQRQSSIVTPGRAHSLTLSVKPPVLATPQRIVSTTTPQTTPSVYLVTPPRNSPSPRRIMLPSRTTSQQANIILPACTSTPQTSIVLPSRTSSPQARQQSAAYQQEAAQFQFRSNWTNLHQQQC